MHDARGVGGVVPESERVAQLVIHRRTGAIRMQPNGSISFGASVVGIVGPEIHRHDAVTLVPVFEAFPPIRLAEGQLNSISVRTNVIDSAQLRQSFAAVWRSREPITGDEHLAAQNLAVGVDSSQRISLRSATNNRGSTTRSRPAFIVRGLTHGGFGIDLRRHAAPVRVQDHKRTC